MKDKWPTPLRTSEWILALLIVIIGYWQSGAQIRVTGAGDSTRVTIPLSGTISAKLLNFSPSHKILVKVNGKPETIRQLTTSLRQLALPSNSGVRRVRTIPIGESAFLLVIDFWERLPFRVHASDNIFNLAIGDGPYRNQLESWFRRGLYYHRQNELKKALAYYRKVVFQDRKHGNAYFKAGQIRFAWKQYRLAEINFRNAIRGGTDSVRVYYFLSQLYRQTHQLAKADEYARLYQENIHKVSKKLPVDTTKNKPRVSPVKLAVHQSEAHATSEAEAESDTTTQTAAVTKSSVLPFRWTTTTKTFGVLLGVILIGIAGMGVLRRRGIKTATENKSIPLQVTKPQEAITYTSAENIEEKKEKILALFEGALREEPETVSEAKTTAPVAPKLQSPSEAGVTSSLEEDADVFAEPEPKQDARQLAKELNIGVGEVELALLMSSHQVHNNRHNDYRKAILQLRAQNKSIAEIARELNIGRSEVEIVLKLMNFTA